MAERKPVTLPRLLGMCLMVWLYVGAVPASAHHPDGAGHGTKGATRATPPASLPNSPGFPSIKGGDFRLTDSNGQVRTARNPNGEPQLLFFGYANCQAICSVTLPRIAEAVDHLKGRGISITPVLITVDPKRDTIATLQPALSKVHARFVGLTGSDADLAKAYSAFQVERQVVFTHPDYGDVYAHGSYIYLLDADGAFRTLLPPVLSAERIAEVVSGYVK